MSMRDGAVSGSARARIRSFSVWLWVGGAVVLAVGALNTFADVGIGDEGFGIIADNENPWEVPDPPIFEPDGVTYSGEGSGLIRIPLQDHDEDAYAVSLISGDYLDLYVTEADDIGRPDGARGYPTSLGYLYDPKDDVLVLPPDADLELWVRTDNPWQFTLQKAEVVEMTDGFASGTGNDFLVYRGDAVSARFVHKGEGVFYVTVQTRGERSDQPLIESGEVDQRLSWDPTDSVYISIEADDGRGAWSVDIDELAPDTPEPAVSPRGTP